eukprot:CAMPEP_0172736214 /NCGR_PEP_ID=MMETSP1074-20121228/114470_1 /TAXON_ID=2916 /ORGANISM="Ceratium fusus, Strain PA161109" /LENGTH=688 /DNA_ID=CAMNT_0013565377 /DNA_START=10 /DNA_END=2076 /DNA_ORIENTATION=+
MASSVVLVVVIALRAAGVAAKIRFEGRGTPIDRVVTLLGKLRENLQEEGTREAAGYDKYACFCKEQANKKLFQIDKSGTIIGELDASVKVLGDEITGLDSDIVDLKESIKKEEDDVAKAREIRNKEFETFTKKQASLVEGVEVITKAKEELEMSKDEVEQASSLLATTKQKLAALPQLDSKIIALAAQEPADYKFSSGDIIAVLKKLLATFKGQLAELEEDERLAKHDYDMIQGARFNSIKSYQADIDEKEKLSAAKTEEKAEKEDLLNEETEAKNSDQAFLDDLTTSCEAKAAAWDERSKMRASELTALTEAIEILKGMGDMYNVNKKLVGLVSLGKKTVSRQQKPTATLAQPHSFLQLQGTQLRAHQLAAFLSEKAKQLRSPMLAALAQKGLSGEDHFGKVRSIIKDLIKTLSEAAAAEADAKQACDTDVEAAVQKRDKYQAQMETTAASIDALKADIETLKTDIAALAVEVADLHKALNELTELREGEKVENQRTVKDSEAGAEAVKKAIAALQEHYAKQGDAMVQLAYKPPKSDREGNTVSDLAPETFEGEYTGKVTESKGVIGLLEVIQSDFERTASTTIEKEKLAEQEFQKQSGEMKSSIEEKEKAKSTKEGEVEKKNAELTGLKDDLKSHSALHEGAQDELQKLKAACTDGEESYEERRRRREQEIDALKEAMRILEDWQN